MKHVEGVFMHETLEEATGRAKGSVLAIFPMEMQGKYQKEMIDPIPPSSVIPDDVKAVSRARRGLRARKWECRCSGLTSVPQGAWEVQSPALMVEWFT